MLNYSVKSSTDEIRHGQTSYVREHAAQFKALLREAKRTLNYKPKRVCSAHWSDSPFPIKKKHIHTITYWHA